MLKAVRSDLMFDFIRESWNPLTGCLHDCYNGRCWARIACERFRKVWGHGFEPAFHPGRLKRKFKPGSIVFVCSLGDLFGDWVPGECIRGILGVIAANPRTTFFLQTKNPGRYLSFVHTIPPNVILSTTIETNRDLGFSKAPPQSARIRAMCDERLKGFKKHISIEPIMDFDLEEFVEAIRSIEPVAVSIGYDNYGAGLPEPPPDKAAELAARLAGFTEVHVKPSKRKLSNRCGQAAGGGRERPFSRIDED